LRDYVRMLGLPVFWSAFGDLDHSLRTSEPAFTKCHLRESSAIWQITRRKAASSTRR
jgi:hypothetical protein